jgi:tetratricopeptide (TPR) repeat protein
MINIKALMKEKNLENNFQKMNDNDIKLFNIDEAKNILSLREICDEFIEKTDYVNALSIAKKLVVIGGQIEDWNTQAICQYQLGYYEHAMKTYTEIINIDDQNIYAWVNLGRLLNKIGMYDKALTCLDYATKLDLEPGSQEALELLISLAFVLANNGRYEESLVLSDHIIKVKPDLEDIWLFRGLTLNDLGYHEQALHSIEQTLLIKPNHVEALLNKGSILLELKLYEEALPFLNKSIELDNSNYLAWLERGFLFFDLEFYSEALFSYDKSIESGNKSYSVLVNRALSLLAMKNWKSAIEAFEVVFDEMSSVENFVEQITNKIVFHLLENLNCESEWQQPVQSLFKTYDKYSISHQLDKALIDSISFLLPLTFNIEKLRDWKKVWQDCVEARPEFETSLCLLDTAVNYRETKGSPLIYLELSKKDKNLFESLLGVEQSPNPLDESKLILDAGFIALNGYRFLGRGVVVFFGEQPKYLIREENMPCELLALVDDYTPEREFIIMPSNHKSASLIEFEEIGIGASVPLTDEEYRQELEKHLEQLVQQGLNRDVVSSLRQIVLTHRNKNLKLNSYPPEILSFFQNLLEENISGNWEPLINLLNRNVSND